MDDREISEATQRMAKTLGADFITTTPMDEQSRDGLLEPVAWRWRYLYNHGPSPWTLRGTSILSQEATQWGAAIEAEPLYSVETVSALTTPEQLSPLSDGVVERCQRALDSAVIDFASEPVTIDSDDLREFLAALSRPSLEPSDAMIEAAYKAAKADGLTGTRQDCRNFVRLVLTAALQHGEGFLEPTLGSHAEGVGDRALDNAWPKNVMIWSGGRVSTDAGKTWQTLDEYHATQTKLLRDDILAIVKSSSVADKIMLRLQR